jgi:CheY-like chemotaxis protein
MCQPAARDEPRPTDPPRFTERAKVPNSYTELPPDVTLRENPAGAARRETPPRPGVLVVDDDAALRDVLDIWLRQDGFEVWLAGCGREAIRHHRQHRHVIAAVVLDVHMPGMDGHQTLVALRELNPQVRCCFLSGDLGGYTEEQLRQAGAVAILRKPTELDEVARMVWLLAASAVKGLPGV